MDFSTNEKQGWQEVYELNRQVGKTQEEWELENDDDENDEFVICLNHDFLWMKVDGLHRSSGDLELRTELAYSTCFKNSSMS